ncbi:hypothetical protein BU15DRAFT_38575 [Melanogaster broomeanus]|nr:hypothetical protein BU15DRAFT_38575 [Melanogaster broomeanus]
MTFTRSQFDEACKEFIQRQGEHDFSPDRPVYSTYNGWAWKEHSHLTGFGYMERTTRLSRQSMSPSSDPLPVNDDGGDSTVEPTDDAAALPLPADTLTCHQYVVFSATFQVPTFYFSVHDLSAAPLVLSDIMKTSLLRQHAFDGADMTVFSIGQTDSNFPLLSFGDHPTLSTPCWYLHPCETGPAVDAILKATQEDRRHMFWLEAWFLVLSSVVDLRG